MLDYTLLEFEEAVPFLGESRAPVAAINAPSHRERHNRGNIANRPHERNSHRNTERETTHMARDPGQERRPREHSTKRARPPSRPRAPAPRGGAGNAAPIDACFDCGKIGVKSGHPGCSGPNEKGKAALAAYKKRVDRLPRARSPHVMAAVAPSKDAPRMSYARAASSTADPDRERAISFSVATISRHPNSALEEEDSDSDNEIPALAPLSELNDLDDNSESQTLCPRHHRY